MISTSYSCLQVCNKLWFTIRFMKSFSITYHSLQCYEPKATNLCRSSKQINFFMINDGIQVDDEGVV